MLESTTDRRRFLASLTGCGALAGLSAHLGSTLQAGEQPTATPAAAPPVDVLSRVPWPYQPLDPEEVGRAAYRVYQKGLCMRGVFEGVVGEVAARLGPPFTAFPFAMFAYGAGGAAGWGSLCGTLNGAAAALCLLAPNPAPLIGALFAWYEREPLPDVVPAGTTASTGAAVAGSVLCHASVGAWRRVTGKAVASPERFERCGLLAASVARKTVQLLNAGTAAPASPDRASSACLACHGRGGTAPAAMGRMSCALCHTSAALRAVGHPNT